MSKDRPTINKCECGWTEDWNKVNPNRNQCPKCGANYQTTEKVRRYFEP